MPTESAFSTEEVTGDSSGAARVAAGPLYNWRQWRRVALALILALIVQLVPLGAPHPPAFADHPEDTWAIWAAPVPEDPLRSTWWSYGRPEDSSGPWWTFLTCQMPDDSFVLASARNRPAEDIHQQTGLRCEGIAGFMIGPGSIEEVFGVSPNRSSISFSLSAAPAAVATARGAAAVIWDGCYVGDDDCGEPEEDGEPEVEYLAIAGFDLPGLIDVLIAFLEEENVEYAIDGATLFIVAGEAIRVTNAVCAAAETEVVLGGRSKGQRLGSVTERQLLAPTVCQTLSAAVGTAVPIAVAEFIAGFRTPPRGRPDGPGDVPGGGGGVDRAPGLRVSADGSGGSGNWPSTALSGDCDDDAIPEDLSHPVNLSTDGLSQEAIADLWTYARLSNSWLAKAGPVEIVTTRTLRPLMRLAVAGARRDAQNAGLPFEGNVGHVPDTAISGDPYSPCGWLDIDPAANSKAGGALGPRVGQTITHFTIDGVIPTR